MRIKPFSIAMEKTTRKIKQLVEQVQNQRTARTTHHVVHHDNSVSHFATNEEG
jgi:hypothetical protein